MVPNWLALARAGSLLEPTANAVRLGVRGFHLLGVYQVSTSGRGLRALAAGGSEPTISPDGKRLAFIRDNRLWAAGHHGGGAHAVTSSAIAEAEPHWGSR